MAKNERTIAFGVVTDEAGVGDQIKKQQDISLDAVVNAIPKFLKVDDYTTFRAEYALQDSAIVIHFYFPPEFKGDASIYWATRFPQALDVSARSYFNADRPRLQAKYTQELNSWWFRASGYDHIVDMAGFIRGFFDALDAALEARA